MRPISRKLRKFGTLLLVGTLLGVAPAPEAALATGSPALPVAAQAPLGAHTGAKTPEDDAPAPAAAPPGVRLLSSSTPYLADRSGELRLTVTVTAGEQPRPAENAHLLLDRTPLTSGQELTALSPAVGEPVPVRTDPAGQALPLGNLIATVPLPALEPGESESVTVTLSGDQLPLTEADPAGVYLFRVTGAPGLSDTASPIVWRAPQASAVQPLSTVIALRFPAEVAAMPSAAVLDELFSPGGPLGRLLDAGIASGAVLAIDPSLIAAIRARGTDAPAAAVEWLERLRTAPNETFPLPFADADLAAQAQLGYSRPLQPENLTFVTRKSSFPVTPPDPESTTSPGAEQPTPSEQSEG
ncbi:DUF6049 family protein, partial [Leucobacter sp. M11]|uniref:DUF6049 family protein n=1 Tax=Leucobacter sp. M11 TaxID=2993565 RepID=UPI002D7F77C6